MLLAQHRSLHKPPRMPFFAYGTQDHKSCLYNCPNSRHLRDFWLKRRRCVVSGDVSTPGHGQGEGPVGYKFLLARTQ